MPSGRLPKITPAIQAQIAELFFLAFTDEQVAFYVGVHQKTIQRARAGLFCPAIKKAEIDRERVYRQRIWDSKGNWCGAAWFLERKYPHQFAKPEITLGIQNNYTQNNLNITISAGEAAQLDAAAEPVRKSVRDMYAKYRPQLPENGNGHDDKSSKKATD